MHKLSFLNSKLRVCAVGRNVECSAGSQKQSEIASAGSSSCNEQEAGTQLRSRPGINQEL